MADKDKREYVKGVLKDDDSSPLQRALYRLWLKPLARPRGDQTQGGAIIPGLTPDKTEKTPARQRRAEPAADPVKSTKHSGE